MITTSYPCQAVCVVRPLDIQQQLDILSITTSLCRGCYSILATSSGEIQDDQMIMVSSSLFHTNDVILSGTTFS
jgi:hypothetical protein